MSFSLSHAVFLADWSIKLLPEDLSPDKKFVIIVVIIGCVTGVLCTLFGVASSTINSIHRRRVEADMKRDMIERGMSADEIAKVIESTAPPEDGAQRWIASWANKKK